MIKLLKKILGQPIVEKPVEKPAFDIEKAVGHILLNLPECSSKIVAVCPKYGDNHYHCKVTVNTRELILWLKKMAESGICLDDRFRAKEIALEFWLKAANFDNSSPTNIPSLIFEMLKPFIETLVTKYNADVYCYECRKVINNVEMKSFNEKDDDMEDNLTEEWYCQEGHLLYRETSEPIMF